MSIGTGGTVIRTEILGANNRLRMVMVRSRKYDVAAALFGVQDPKDWPGAAPFAFKGAGFDVLYLLQTRPDISFPMKSSRFLFYLPGLSRSGSN
jgi:hypothetical protein